jgi:hypothetical protein
MTARDLAFYTDVYCPQCGKTDRVAGMTDKSARMHPCPKLRGLHTAMVRSDTSAEIVLHEREDYINGKSVQLDPELGRPVMNMQTRYADGRTDVTVYAPTASVKARR